MPAVDLAQRAANQEPEMMKADIAFIVFRLKDGQYGLQPNINAPMTVEREPTKSEMRSLMKELITNLDAEQIAQQAALFAMQATMGTIAQAQDQMMTQQLSGQLGNLRA